MKYIFHYSTGGYLASEKPYSWVKEQLETSFQDKKFIFCKEISYGLINAGYFKYIPDGFRNTFLIRHPYKVMNSWKRMINRGIKEEEKKLKMTDQPECLFPSGCSFKEQYDIYAYVRKNIEPNPVIIDTDDLLADSKRVLKAYCQELGIPYSDDLLHWKPGGECMEELWITAKEGIQSQNLGSPHAETFSSTCFGAPSKLPDRSELPEDVLYCADKCMKYYDEMYANKLQLWTVIFPKICILLPHYKLLSSGMHNVE